MLCDVSLSVRLFAECGILVVLLKIFSCLSKNGETGGKCENVYFCRALHTLNKDSEVMFKCRQAWLTAVHHTFCRTIIPSACVLACRLQLNLV